MDKDKPTVDGTQAAVPGDTVTPTVVTETGDVEAKLAQLEADKQKAIEEAANYKLAFLKEKSKAKPDLNLDEETDEERTRRIIREELSNSKIAQIEREKEDLLKQALKENKELKLAQLNKTQVPVSTGSPTESTPVSSTLVTPEQIAAFKARGWTTTDIERYKKNLSRFMPK